MTARLPGTKWGALFSAESDEWSTPLALFDGLNAEFGFDVDVAARQENAKCHRFFSVEENGLAVRWEGTCWMNPPYSDVTAWAQKAYRESRRGLCMVVGLLFSRTDTRWWHEYAMRASEIRFIRGRVKFTRPDRDSVGSPAPSAIIVWRAGFEGPPAISTWEQPH